MQDQDFSKTKEETLNIRFLSSSLRVIRRKRWTVCWAMWGQARLRLWRL